MAFTDPDDPVKAIATATADLNNAVPSLPDTLNDLQRQLQAKSPPPATDLANVGGAISALAAAKTALTTAIAAARPHAPQLSTAYYQAYINLQNAPSAGIAAAKDRLALAQFNNSLVTQKIVAAQAAFDTAVKNATATVSATQKDLAAPAAASR